MKQSKNDQVYNSLYLMCKTRILLLLSAILTVMSSAFAQPNNMNGNWKGNIIMQDDSFSAFIELSIVNNQVVAIVDKTKSNYWFKKAHLVQKYHADSVILKWTFDCPVGVQSRVYKLSNINAKGATMSFNQHTTFYGDNKKIKEDFLEVAGTGYLEKTPPDAVASNRNNF